VPNRTERRTVAPRALLALFAVLAAIGTACSGATGTPLTLGGGPSATASTSPTPRLISPLNTGKAGDLQPYGDTVWPAYAVSPRGKTLTVYAKLGGTDSRTFSSRLPSGAQQTFLLVNRRSGWLQIELPVRPNGSSGWVRETDARLAGLRYGIKVSRGAHTLRLYDRERLMHTYPVGIGTKETPTPGGLYYLAELLRPPNPNGAYGPYAYGLSGFSDVIHHFNGGDGVIGLHGTNQPSKVGTDVSHGCIRMHNKDITTLVRLLPLGTPVRIVV
jgi:lipoprotein-anchoring transpeptidase ErfK/SrfK